MESLERSRLFFVVHQSKHDANSINQPFLVSVCLRVMLPINKSHAKSLYVILIVILITSCTQDDTPINDSLFGKWQLIEKYDGGSPKPNQAVENGYIMNLNTDFTVSTTNPTIGCPENYDHLNGTFETTTNDKGKLLSIELTCGNSSMNIEYYYGVDSKGFLVITPKESTCDEGCSSKFKRIEVPKTKD